MVLRVRTVKDLQIIAVVPQPRAARSTPLRPTVAERLPMAARLHPRIQEAQDHTQRRDPTRRLDPIQLRARASTPRAVQPRISLVEVPTSRAAAIRAAEGMVAAAVIIDRT